MKKLFLFFSLLGLISCTSHSKWLKSHNKMCLTKDQMAEWSSRNDTIFHNNNPIAIYDHIEFELNPSHGRHEKPIAEISILQITYGDTETLMKFLHTLHGTRKIEIVVPKKFIKD